MAKFTAKKVVRNKPETKMPGEEKTITAILQNKATKAKEKIMMLSSLLLNEKLTINELIENAKAQNDTTKATLIAAVEYASKINAEIINSNAFQFVIKSLKEDAPRVKWEAAKVISNTAHLFPKMLSKAVPNLLYNAEHSGSVVRWSAATAISKIILLNTPLNKELVPAAEAIVLREEDNAVKKIYQHALKKCKL